MLLWVGCIAGAIHEYGYLAKLASTRSCLHIEAIRWTTPRRHEPTWTVKVWMRSPHR
jgi:hypothetical protein